MTANPYRVSDGPPPRFVCVACYRTASKIEPGICSLCGSPRVPLESQQVRDDVRAHTERTQQRALTRRLTFEFVGFTLLSIALYVLLGVVGVVDLNTPRAFGRLPVEGFVFVPLWLACVLGGGAVVELRARRGRVDTDPATLRMPELLQFLGVRVEGPGA